MSDLVDEYNRLGEADKAFIGKFGWDAFRKKQEQERQEREAQRAQERARKAEERKKQAPEPEPKTDVVLRNIVEQAEEKLDEIDELETDLNTLEETREKIIKEQKQSFPSQVVKTANELIAQRLKEVDRILAEEKGKVEKEASEQVQKIKSELVELTKFKVEFFQAIDEAIDMLIADKVKSITLKFSRKDDEVFLHVEASKNE